MTRSVGGALFLAMGLLSVGAETMAEPVTAAVAKTNLAKVPATDPAPTSVVSLLPAMLGQHPRLLFTRDQADALKKTIARDPLLKQTYADNAAWAGRFNLAKSWQPTAIMREDTPAIVMVKSWPSLAYVYAIDQNPTAKKAILDILAMMLKEPYWADTAEFESSMGAGENLLMVGILFDAICDDLDPDFRRDMAQNIFVHVRRMYYLGHQKLCTMPVKYWQCDPANNHRWHRDAGMAACLLAIADEKQLDTRFMLQQLKAEMDLLIEWYPSDGDCHEGAGYQTFGFFYLAIACNMMDRVLGTHYLAHPGFCNAWAQQLYYGAPGRMSNISFGDDMNGNNVVFDNQEAAFFLGPKLSRDANVQAALLHRFEQKNHFPASLKRTYTNPWAFLTFYDPTVGSGNYKAVPTYRLFEDIGAASMRDSWEEDAVCLTFKCGPYGGYKLNGFAHANKDAAGKPAYINVAHDDPDANEFALGMAGEFLFHPGLYSLHKLTQTHNTVTINGKGQINEGSDYTQPVPGVDMRKLSYLTGWKADEQGRIIIEGEAANAYPEQVLEQFRRSVIWLPGEYVLILDDLRANAAHRITWRGTVEKGQFENPAQGLCYCYTQSGKRLDFQILANREFNGAIDDAFLDGRFGSALLQQFQFSVDAQNVKFACLLDPWKKKARMTLEDKGEYALLTVTCGDRTDSWRWERGADSTTPSSIIGTRAGKQLISLTVQNKLSHGATESSH